MRKQIFIAIIDWFLLLLTIKKLALAWSQSELIFFKIICRFYIHPFTINNMSFLTLIFLDKVYFIFLSFFSITKLHFDESKSSSSLCLFISHDNSICNHSKLFKVIYQIWFLSLKSKTSNKQFNFIIRSFSMECSCMGSTSWY